MKFDRDNYKVYRLSKKEQNEEPEQGWKFGVRCVATGEPKAFFVTRDEAKEYIEKLVTGGFFYWH